MKIESLAEYIIEKIRSYKIIDGSSVSVSNASSKSVKTINGDFEAINSSEDYSVNLLLFSDSRLLNIATNSLSTNAIDKFIEKAAFMVTLAETNPYARLATDKEAYSHLQFEPVCDYSCTSEEQLFELAKECEESALSVNGIHSSERAEAEFSHIKSVIANSNGIIGRHERTVYSLSTCVIAGSDSDTSERGYDFSSSTRFLDLKTPNNIGKEAARRAVSSLGGKKIKSCIAEVVFEPRISRQFLGYFLRSINGNPISKKSSFMHDKLYKNVFNKQVNIIEDPFIPYGLKSRNFDGELVECKKLELVKNGTLSSFLLNIESASKLKLETNGHSGGGGSIISHNTYITGGETSFDDMLSSVKQGFLVTEVLGSGLDIISGNYSQGASGFWIENGEIAFPIKEVTIAGNMIDIFSSCIFASDLKIETGCDAPSMYVENMTISGE